MSAGQSPPTTEDRSRVVGEVSPEVRALSAERAQLWRRYLDANTEAERETVMPLIEGITERINRKLEREFVE